MIAKAIKKFITNESGSFISSLIWVVVIVGILGLLVVDGTKVFLFAATTSDATQEAANMASRDFEINHSNIQAENVAADYCESKGLAFMKFDVFRGVGQSYTVTCGGDAKTFIFKYLPVLKNQLHHESTATSSGL